MNLEDDYMREFYSMLINVIRVEDMLLLLESHLDSGGKKSIDIILNLVDLLGRLWEGGWGVSSIRRNRKLLWSSQLLE